MFLSVSFVRLLKLSGDSISSYPSTLYDTTPLIGAVKYSAPSFKLFSYSLRSSINFFKYEPDGLNSPAILAFFVILSLSSFLVSLIV